MYIQHYMNVLYRMFGRLIFYIPFLCWIRISLVHPTSYANNKCFNEIILLNKEVLFSSAIAIQLLIFYCLRTYISLVNQKNVTIKSNKSVVLSDFWLGMILEIYNNIRQLSPQIFIFTFFINRKRNIIYDICYYAFMDLF